MTKGYLRKARETARRAKQERDRLRRARRKRDFDALLKACSEANDWFWSNCVWLNDKNGANHVHMQLRSAVAQVNGRQWGKKP